MNKTLIHIETSQDGDTAKVQFEGKHIEMLIMLTVALVAEEKLLEVFREAVLSADSFKEDSFAGIINPNDYIKVRKGNK